MNYKTKDYSHLEGKIIDWVNEESNEKYKVNVANIEYDIGITMVVAENYTRPSGSKIRKNITEMTCINGPNSPHKTVENYDDLFKYCASAIEKGVYSCVESEKIVFGNIIKNTGVMASCAFK